MTGATTASDAAAAVAVARCALPSADPADAVAALVRLLPDDTADDDVRRTARHLVSLARSYGNDPFAPLEQVRAALHVDRARFRFLLDRFATLPGLRDAVLRGPAGKYWSNTTLPLEREGALDHALARTAVFPHVVGLYPGPTCMFRCHFCVRVTGARYEHELLADGNAVLARVIDEMPVARPYGMYLSGGLEPLTNPGLGELVRRAAGRGLRLTLYTNAFALTAATLRRQPGLRELHALRTSLYGLDDAEYRTTTGRRDAFTRVRANLLEFQRWRRELNLPVQLGLNYIVLPGRVDRLPRLADFVAGLNEAVPDRPVDFVTLREDYSGRPDGRLTDSERAEMVAGLAAFDDRVTRLAPTLHVDYGYALHSLRMGEEGRLIRVRHDEMRPAAHPQVAVQVDLRGDVYLYREAGFPGLPGAGRYIAGRVTRDTSLADVVRRFVDEGSQVAPLPGDEYFMDGFDQAVTARLRQLEQDVAAGWGGHRGFLR